MGHGGRGKPGAGGSAVDDTQQQEAGLAQPGMGKPHQALDVGELGVHRAAEGLHSRPSQSTTSASVMVGRSKPSRSRVFRARSNTVRPG